MLRVVVFCSFRYLECWKYWECSGVHSKEWKEQALNKTWDISFHFRSRAIICRYKSKCLYLIWARWHSSIPGPTKLWVLIILSYYYYYIPYLSFLVNLITLFLLFISWQQCCSYTGWMYFLFIITNIHYYSTQFTSKFCLK